MPSGELGSIQVGINLELQKLQQQMTQVIGMFDSVFKKVDSGTKQTAREYERQWAKANKEVEATVKRSAAEFAKAESAKAAALKRVSAEVEREALKRQGIEDKTAKAHVESVLKQEAATKAALTREIALYDKQAAQRLVIYEKELQAELHAQQAQELKLLQVQTQAAAKRKAALPGVIKNVGTAGFAVGIPLAVGLGAAAKTAAEFDQAMRNVDSIAHLTEKQLESLRLEVLKLTQDKSIRQTPKDMAEGLYQVYSAGKSGKEGLEILEWGAKGASAGMTDTATATKVLLAVLNSGIGGVNNAREAMDVLFQEVNLGVNTFPELANSLGTVMPIAKLMGVSIQEVSAALAAMTRNGVSLDESVTALNTMMTHIQRPGKDTQKLMTSLGIAFGSTAFEAKGLGGWLEDAMKKTHGNKDQIAKLIPEMRGAKGEMILLSDGVKGYNELLVGMKKASENGGVATDALTRQNKGSVAQYELLRKEIDLTAVAIGNTLLPTVNKAMKGFREWLDGWNKQTEATKNAQIGMATFTVEAALALGVTSKLVGWVVALNANFGKLGITLSALKMPLWLTRLGGVAFGVSALTAASPASAQTLPNGGFDKDPATREKQLRDRLSYYKRITTTPPPLRQGWEGMDAQYATQEGFARAQSERARLEGLLQSAQSEQVVMPPKDTNTPNPWGVGGSAANAGKGGGTGGGDGRRKGDREQIIKDSIREATDESRLLQDLLTSRKRLALQGYELAVFESQKRFDATMKDAKTPAVRAAAALLYQAEIRKAQESEALEAMRKSVAAYKEQTNVPDGVRDDSKEKGWGTLSGGMASLEAVRKYSEEVADAIAKEVEEQKRAQDEIMQYRLTMGQITNAQYIKFLEQRVQAERTYGFGNKETSEQNPEFRAKNLELRKHYEEALGSIFGGKGEKSGKEAAQNIAEGLSQGNQYLKRAMEDVGGGALGTLQKALRKGLKGGFGDILANTLSDLLSNVLTNAIEGMFKKKKKASPLDIFGGGGLLGSFLSPISNLFGGGGDRSVSPAGRSVGGSHTVNVHMGTTNIHNDTDVTNLVNRVAWETQNALRRSL